MNCRGQLQVNTECIQNYEACCLTTNLRIKKFEHDLQV